MTDEIPPNKPWWYDFHAICELAALSACCFVVGHEVFAGKLDAPGSIALIVGAVATITRMVVTKTKDGVK